MTNPQPEQDNPSENRELQIPLKDILGYIYNCGTLRENNKDEVVAINVDGILELFAADQKRLLERVRACVPDTIHEFPNANNEDEIFGWNACRNVMAAALHKLLEKEQPHGPK